MKGKKSFQVAFLVVGTLAALEFIFVQGMFTWLMAVMATFVVGALNIFVAIKDREWISLCFYLLLVVALSMGPLSLAF